jgi:tRNA(adenine34) deaminase
MSDSDFMTLAVEQAKKGLYAGEVPVGCVFVKDGKVIAESHNLTC